MEALKTEFQPAEINFNYEVKTMDEIINILNSYKKEFKKEGFYLDWYYADFMQCLNPSQISVDIVFRVMKEMVRPAPDEEKSAVFFTVEKGNALESLDVIKKQMKILIGE